MIPRGLRSSGGPAPLLFPTPFPVGHPVAVPDRFSPVVVFVFGLVFLAEMLRWCLRGLRLGRRLYGRLRATTGAFGVAQDRLLAVGPQAL